MVREINFGALVNLVMRTPDLQTALSTAIDDAINSEKLRFIDNLRAEGRDTHSIEVSKEQLANTVRLYKEMSEGLHVCAHDLEQKVQDDPTLKPQLDKLLDQVNAIEQTMQARMQILTAPPSKEADQARQEELEHQRLLQKQALEEKEKKEKEVEKEEKAAREWKEFIQIFLPDGWKKTMEHEVDLHVEAHKHEQETKKVEVPNIEKTERILEALFSKAEPTGVEHQRLPMTEDARRRREEENKAFSELHQPPKKES